MKRILKDEHMIRTGDPDFSLSNCSMDTAREFINTILEFALEWGIPLSDNAIDRTDDIGRYLYYCLMHKNVPYAGKTGRSIMRMQSAWGITAGRWMIPITKRSACAGHITRSHIRWALSGFGRCIRCMELL